MPFPTCLTGKTFFKNLNFLRVPGADGWKDRELGFPAGHGEGCALG